MWIFIIAALILFIMFLTLHLRHKNPVKAAAFNMLSGVFALVLIAPVVSVAVNVYTVFTVLTLGLPGAVLVAIAAKTFS